MSPEDLLLCYDELAPDERARADAYLAAHPEAQALLDEGRGLRALVRLARPPSTPEAAAADRLAGLAAAFHTAQGPPLGEEQRLLDLTGEHPDLEQHFAELNARAKEVVQGGTPALEHFEALTGRSLGATSPPPRVRDRTSTPSRRSGDRQALPQGRRLVRVTSAAALLLIGLYGGLFLASEATQPLPHRLAELERVPAAYQGLRLRGGDGEVDRVADRYAAGREAMMAARTSVLGLFPRYDEGQLETALQAFDAASAYDSVQGALGLEARFQAGRIHLHRGETAAAREAFEEVVARSGPSAPEARGLLTAMDERGL